MKQVMRWAGPRMLWRHPILTIRHLIDDRRPVPELPEKYRPKNNRLSAAVDDKSRSARPRCTVETPPAAATGKWPPSRAPAPCPAGCLNLNSPPAPRCRRRLRARHSALKRRLLGKMWDQIFADGTSSICPSVKRVTKLAGAAGAASLPAAPSRQKRHAGKRGGEQQKPLTAPTFRAKRARGNCRTMISTEASINSGPRSFRSRRRVGSPPAAPDRAGYSLTATNCRR